MADYTVLREGYNEVVLQWTLTNSDSEGQAVKPSALYRDKTFHVYGTFGGATVKIQGTNETGNNPTNWIDLKNLWGVAMSFTSAGMGVLAENPWRIRPVLTGGSNSSVTVLLCMRS